MSRAYPGTYAALLEAVATRQAASKKATRGIVEAFIVLLGEVVWEHGRLNVPGLGAFRVHPGQRVRLPSGAVVKPRKRITCRVSAQWRTR